MNCVDIISRAMRNLGVLAGGELPLLSEQEDALDILKGIYRSLITDGAFGTLTEVEPTGDEYCAGVNQRVTPTLPKCEIKKPANGAHHGVLAVVDVFRNQVDEYLFDANTKRWLSIDDMKLTSYAPFAQGDPNGLAYILSIHLAPSFGQTPDPIIMQMAARWQSGLVHSWSQEDRPTRGVYY